MVFVGGLHRSGTSLLAEILGSNSQASELTGTGVHEDEGQHLQSVYTPLNDLSGKMKGPGKFAWNPEAHMTERDAAVPAQLASSLFFDWSRYWDLSKPVLVEKSPGNMIKARFLQTVFPESRFVFIVRHPVAVTLATRRFSEVFYARLVRHWVRAHHLMLQDAEHIKHLRIVRYEDLVSNPERLLPELTELLGLPKEAPKTEIRSQINSKYLSDWATHDTAHRLLRVYARVKLERPASTFGYDLNDGSASNAVDPKIRPYLLLP